MFHAQNLAGKIQLVRKCFPNVDWDNNRLNRMAMLSMYTDYRRGINAANNQASLNGHTSQSRLGGRDSVRTLKSSVVSGRSSNSCRGMKQVNEPLECDSSHLYPLVDFSHL